MLKQRHQAINQQRRSSYDCHMSTKSTAQKVLSKNMLNDDLDNSDKMPSINQLYLKQFFGNFFRKEQLMEKSNYFNTSLEVLNNLIDNFQANNFASNTKQQNTKYYSNETNNNTSSFQAFYNRLKELLESFEVKLLGIDNINQLFDNGSSLQSSGSTLFPQNKKSMSKSDNRIFENLTKQKVSDQQLYELVMELKQENMLKTKQIKELQQKNKHSSSQKSQIQQLLSRCQSERAKTSSQFKKLDQQITCLTQEKQQILEKFIQLTDNSTELHQINQALCLKITLLQGQCIQIQQLKSKLEKEKLQNICISNLLKDKDDEISSLKSNIQIVKYDIKENMEALEKKSQQNFELKKIINEKLMFLQKTNIKENCRIQAQNKQNNSNNQLFADNNSLQHIIERKMKSHSFSNNKALSQINKFAKNLLSKNQQLLLHK